MRFGLAIASVTLTASLAAPQLAHAQVAPTPVAAEPAAVAAPTYSPTAALALSLGATAAGAGMFAYGVHDANVNLVDLGILTAYLGPSAGHVYTGEFLTRGLGVRTAGAATVIAGLAVELDDCGFLSDASCEPSNLARGLLVAGLAISAAGVIDDIVTAPMRANRKNREAARLSLAPQVAPGRAGLAVAGTF